MSRYIKYIHQEITRTWHGCIWLHSLNQSEEPKSLRTSQTGRPTAKAACTAHIQHAYEADTTSDRSSLSMATEVIRQDIFAMWNRSKGRFDNECQTKSVLKLIYILVIEQMLLPRSN